MKLETDKIGHLDSLAASGNAGKEEVASAAGTRSSIQRLLDSQSSASLMHGGSCSVTRSASRANFSCTILCRAIACVQTDISNKILFFQGFPRYQNSPDN